VITLVKKSNCTNDYHNKFASKLKMEFIKTSYDSLTIDVMNLIFKDKLMGVNLSFECKVW
jgi:hypothetical protein